MPIRVTGCGLLSLADDFSPANGYTRTQAVTAAGYYSLKPDGSTRLHFTGFYQELLGAKERLGLWTPPEQNDEDEECEPTEMEAAIAEHFPEVDEDDIADFAKAMSDDFGFTPEEMWDNFRGKYHNVEEFAEAWYKEQGNCVPDALEDHIDWDGVFSSKYEAAHDIYEYGDYLYFFYVGG